MDKLQFPRPAWPTLSPAMRGKIRLAATVIMLHQSEIVKLGQRMTALYRTLEVAQRVQAAAEAAADPADDPAYVSREYPPDPDEAAAWLFQKTGIFDSRNPPTEAQKAAFLAAHGRPAPARAFGTAPSADDPPVTPIIPPTENHPLGRTFLSTPRPIGPLGSPRRTVQEMRGDHCSDPACPVCGGEGAKA